MLRQIGSSLVCSSLIKTLLNPITLCPCRRSLTEHVTSRKRVVVTGLGVVSPLGVGVQRNWSRLIAGESGVKEIRQKDQFGDIKSSAHIDEAELDLEHRFTASDRRTLSLATLYALIAADEALSSSGILQSDHGSLLPHFGCAVGQGMVDLEFVFESLQKKKLSPFFVTRVLPNMAAGHVAIKHGLKGPNLCQATACASGLHSIGDAYHLIKSGKATAMLAGGTEAALNKIGIEAFARMRALSSKPAAEGPSRPFDANRDGFVLGEGCGLLVLEELEHAKSRNAAIHAEIVGFGSSCDAHHTTAPHVDGARRSIEAALDDAREIAQPADVTYVNAHATSTPLGDENELRACESALKVADRRKVDVGSNKGAIGHLLGASGAVEAVFTVLSCEKAILPPSINVTCKMDTNMNVVTQATKWTPERRVALKNSLGFGGTNASILITNYVS